MSESDWWRRAVVAVAFGVRKRPARVGVFLLALTLGHTSFAETSDGRETSLESGSAVTERADSDPRVVGLEKLLRLPDDFDLDVQQRSGATSAVWRDRFERAREDLEEARRRLADAERELDTLSGDSSSWQVAAPGSNTPQTSPLNLRLRQAVKDYRQEIDESERKLRSLAVEADLAAVPADWRD